MLPTNQQKKEEVNIDNIARLMHMNGSSNSEIKALLHIGSSRLQMCINSPINHYINHKRGRKSSLTINVIKYIEQISIADGTLSDQKIADEVYKRYNLRYCRQTICKIRKNLGFTYRPPYTVQFLTNEQMKSRVEFCKKMLESNIDFDRIVFSDESRFCLGPDNCWVHIKKGNWNKTVIKSTSKFNNGMMFFGCISMGFKSSFVRCSNSINSEEYITNIEKSDIVNLMNNKYGEKKWFFMQDGAPCHTSANTILNLQEKLIILPGWPPNSPDLNPIEMLWSIIKRTLHKNPLIPGDLEDKILEIWNSIPQEVIDKLCQSFKNRLVLCLEIGGKSISQYLSSHKKKARECDIMEISDMNLFSNEQDKWILDYVTNNGKKWKQMSFNEIVSTHSPSELKTRYNFLIGWEKLEKDISKIILPSIYDLLNH